MPKLRVHCFSMSVDGFCAGPNQSVENPLGVGGERLHEWVFETAAGRRMIGESGGTDGTDGTVGTEGIDSDFIDEGFDNIGATIMGRNMFGPIRGEWGDEEWRGWWGDNPPYHSDVFVLTHHPRDPLAMEGGTTFHFTDDPLESVLSRAFDAAGGADVRLGGGVSTVQQFMRAGLVDELHIPMAPVLLGTGERLFDGIDADALGYAVTEVVSSAVTHVRLARR